MAKGILAVIVIILAVAFGLQTWTAREYKDIARRWREVAATYQEAWVESARHGVWPAGMMPIRELGKGKDDPNGD